MNDKDNITISLSKDEANILLDWLFRFNENEHKKLFEDVVERQTLYDLESILERQYSIVLDPNYNNLVNKSKKNLMS